MLTSLDSKYPNLFAYHRVIYYDFCTCECIDKNMHLVNVLFKWESSKQKTCCALKLQSWFLRLRLVKLYNYISFNVVFSVLMSRECLKWTIQKHLSVFQSNQSDGARLWTPIQLRNKRRRELTFVIVHVRTMYVRIKYDVVFGIVRLHTRHGSFTPIHVMYCLHFNVLY